MPTKTNTAVTSEQPEKRQHFRYIFIVDDRVIGRTNDLNEAIRLARKHPEAEIRDDYIARDLKSLIGHREYERQRAHENGNPAGKAIEEICGPVLYHVDATIADVIPGGGIEEICWGDGKVHFYGPGTKRSERRATNVECCRWMGNFHADCIFDVRKPIPDQVAAWLTKLSKRALQAADEMQYIDDDRNMKLLNKVVCDKGYLDRLWKQRKQITYGGDIEPIEDHEIEYLAKRRGEKVGAA